jgi:hypothetical protein
VLSACSGHGTSAGCEVVVVEEVGVVESGAVVVVPGSVVVVVSAAAVVVVAGTLALGAVLAGAVLVVAGVVVDGSVPGTVVVVVEFGRHGCVATVGAGASFGIETVGAHPKFDSTDRRTMLVPSSKLVVESTDRM